MNPQRNKFMFDLELDTDLVSSSISRIRIFHLSFEFIIVGSDFDGDSSSAPSSYVFARNGKMELAADGNYDFSTNS